MNRNNVFINEICMEYYDEINKYCRRRVRSSDDAYDLTQEAFLALKEKSDMINPSNVRKWLYNTAHNMICDYYKNKRKETDNRLDINIFNESFNLTTKFIDEIIEEITEEEIKQYKNEIINMLSYEEKVLYEEVKVKHTSYVSLAIKYGISEATLRKRVSRLFYKMRKYIKELQLL